MDEVWRERARECSLGKGNTLRCCFQFPDYTTSLCTLLIWMLILLFFLVSPGCDHTFIFYYAPYKTWKHFSLMEECIFFFVYKYRWLNKLAKTNSSDKRTNNNNNNNNKRQHYKYSPWFIIIIIIIIIIILCIQALSLYSCIIFKDF